MAHDSNHSDELRHLALAMAEAEARQRKRLAQRLHDGFQQFLSAARLKAALVRRTLDAESAGGLLHVERMLEQAIDESRLLTTELSPPVLFDAGLAPALEALARAFERVHPIKIRVEGISGIGPQAELIRVLLFEAVREILSGIIEQSSASAAQVRIQISPEKTVDITVSDDGTGLNATGLETVSQRQKMFDVMGISNRVRYENASIESTNAPAAGAVTSTPQVCKPSPQVRETSSPSASVLQASGAEKLPELQSQRRPGARTIVVADDHAIFREGLINMLSQDSDFQVIGQAADGQEAMEVVQRLQPDILIVDVTMPRLSGIQVTTQLSRAMPELKIVGLSMHDHPDMARAMREAGATEYVTKGGASEALLTVLRRV